MSAEAVTLKIPTAEEQQTAREAFVQKYGTSGWPIPTHEEWYWKQTKRPVDLLPIWKSVFLNPFLEFLGLASIDDPTYGSEKAIREDKKITCWDARLFLKDRPDGLVAEPVEYKTSKWIWYQVWWDEEASKRTGVRLDLLYCHGISEYGGAFAKNARKFLDAGHGRSTGFHVHLTNLDCLAHTVHVVLADITKRDSAAGVAQRPVIVAGQSMGGFTTVSYGRFPLAPAYKGNNTPDTWFEDQFMSDPQGYTGNLRIATGLNILSALDWINQHLADLTVPFQIMHGGSDRVTNPNGSISLYEHSKSSRKSIKIYPFVEHVMLRIGRDDEDDLPRQTILDDMLAWIEHITAYPSSTPLSPPHAPS
ncbi:uncharacterized protein VP01_620g7 [Puccinia sorghi]|uniref:Serine aminopeptidase S33 domain-containing protein n=1 Tax=Puccinia sorghi TaxID=27349 RepID=A0A0L6UHF9_9BASI|nr:uncharacterized protein VP01_620g7 [Puccinia sorghi]